MAASVETTCSTTKTKQLEIRDLKAYLLSLPQGVLQKLYCHPTPCLAVFRQLPRICQLWVMRMLFIDRPIPQTSISSWVKPEYQKSKTYRNNVKELLELQVWRECYLAGSVTACQLTDTFRKNLQVALIGGGSAWLSEVGDEGSDKHARDAAYIKQYGDTRWSAILHYMVGTTAAASTSESSGDGQQTSAALLEQSIAVLKYAGLIDDGSEAAGTSSDRDQPVQLRSSGFQFLLLDTSEQVWYFLLQYLDMQVTGTAGGGTSVDNITSAINFILQLSFSTTGKSYSTEGMSEPLLNFLQHLREFGLVYQRKRSSGRFYPTPLCRLVGEAISVGTSTRGRAGQAAGAGAGPGHLIVETNYRVYAYTDNQLQVDILSLFTQLIARFPNLVVGQLTRESVREALNTGITAQQIIVYLTQHAHPRMLKHSPILPSDVVDQIKLWELELGRFTFTDGVLYSQFLSQADYDLLTDYARDLGVLVHDNPARRMLIVTPAGHDEVRKFWKRQKKSAAAAASASGT